MKISDYIIYYDNRRKSALECFQIWKENQKIGEHKKDYKFSKYCSEQASVLWEEYRKYVIILLKIGVDTGDWKRDDLKEIL